MLKKENYKGYTLRFSRDVYGHLTIDITKKANEGTRREEYAFARIHTYTKGTKQQAFEFAKKYIDKNDGIGDLKLKSNGLTNAKYLPK
jgi:hypothetical protein